MAQPPLSSGNKGGLIMRLWHKDLIPVLPRQQLLGQWRECCLIAKNIAEHGTPNHILVNKIMDYPIYHFIFYSGLVHDEMIKRNYKCDWETFRKHLSGWTWENVLKNITYFDLFAYWHNKRYLDQCYYNLEEKYDCGGISDDEWDILNDYLYENEKRS